MYQTIELNHLSERSDHLPVRDNDLLNIQLMPNQPAWLIPLLEELQGLRTDKAAQLDRDTAHSRNREEWADLYDEAEDIIKTAKRQVDEAYKSIEAAHEILQRETPRLDD
jgi:hypothetical protein